MGFLSNKVDRSQVNPGDHIYTYRALFAYSHHGIFVGGSKVVHFTCVGTLSSPTDDESSLYSFCKTFPDCGLRQPASGVVISCLDCFLQKGSLYRFEYGVIPLKFNTKVRGGTCTIAASHPPESVIHRAMYLLHSGFGNYDVFKNNCEDFAIYCKTGIVTDDKLGIGRSGQITSIFSASVPALVSSLLMPSPVGATIVTAGMYCLSRYSNDIGVRPDAKKVAVEDLAIKGDKSRNQTYRGHEGISKKAATKA